MCRIQGCMVYTKYWVYPRVNREVLCNDDLPVTILDRVATVAAAAWARRLGRTFGPDAWADTTD